MNKMHFFTDLHAILRIILNWRSIFKYAFGRNRKGGYINLQTVNKIPAGFAQDLYRSLIGIPVNGGGKGLRKEVQYGTGF